MSKIQIQIDPDLADIVPGYLENRKADVVKLEGALGAQDFGTIDTLSHRVRGTAAAYGFTDLTEIAKRMESAARARDAEGVRRSLGEWKIYVEAVELKP